jgi:hypothetical protein
MLTTPTERRAAVRLARLLLETPGIDDDVKLLCSTLIDCQEAFTSRLAPIYAASMELVRDDGSQDAKAWSVFKERVLQAKAHDRTLSLPSSEGAG